MKGGGDGDKGYYGLFRQTGDGLFTSFLSDYTILHGSGEKEKEGARCETWHQTGNCLECVVDFESDCVRVVLEVCFSDVGEASKNTAEISIKTH